MLKDFKIPLALTVLALVAAYLLGGVKDMLIVAVLSVLEISLSLDNAVVNASVLKNWSEKWRNRFMVFGLPVAVFGMRLVFPLLIVAVIGHIGLLEALTLAIEAPEKYAAVLTSAHHEVSAFGGAFLLMVFFKFMLDKEKDEHWIGFLEGPMRHFGRITALEVALTLAIVIVASFYVPAAEQVSFLLAGAFGVIGFVIAHGVGDLVGGEDTGTRGARRRRGLHVSRSARLVVQLRRRDRRLRAVEQHLPDRAGPRRRRGLHPRDDARAAQEGHARAVPLSRARRVPGRSARSRRSCSSA
jgi:hypothetical protein